LLTNWWSERANLVPGIIAQRKKIQGV
jgi:hypothetical protein